jgi:CelD/BcsL family acetyltransferase involved in cellulose biosynthesis
MAETMTMTLTKPSANTFNHAAWMRAISAHLPGAFELRVPATGLLRQNVYLRARHFPISHFESWQTSLNNSGLPMAISATAADALAMLDVAEKPLLLRNLPINHPTTAALLEAAPKAFVLRKWERATLALTGSFENWLQGNFDHKRRKELKRLRARLGEQGNLTFESLQAGAKITPFLDDFLHLESAGWKGRRGSAIAHNANAKAALKAALKEMHGLGKLRFWRMHLDGKPIAALFALVDDGVVALGKIAHAEEFARFSPGVLLIVDVTEHLFNEPGCTFADSNAMPDHPMINRIWRDRMSCMDVLVAGHTTSTAEFNILARWLGMKHAARQFIKQGLHRSLGRRTS